MWVMDMVSQETLTKTLLLRGSSLTVGISMNKSVAAMLVLLFLTASYAIAAKPAFSIAAEDTWATKTPMQQARAGLGVVAVDGKIYAIGGSTASGSYRPDAFAGDFVGTNEEYDPETDTWTYREPMPTPRAHFAIAAYKNKIYCIGGAVGFSVDERTGFYSYITSGVTEVYDTVTNTWVTKKSMPDDAMKIQAHVVNGKIYVMDWSLTYVFDPENDSWSLKTRMPQPYPDYDSSPVSAVLDNKIIVTFEFSTFNSSTGFESSEQKVLFYDTETDSWNGGKSGPIGVVQGEAGATTGVQAPQKVYVLGLIVEALLPTVVNQVYDPNTNTWVTASSMAITRSDFGIAVVNDMVYVIGGYLRSSRHVTPTAVSEQYAPVGYGTVVPVVSIISPSNEMYEANSVSLVLGVSKPVSWMGYSLDGKENVTFSGNTTISGLSNGLHNVTVFAIDEFDNIGISETITFNVDVPFPTVPVATASIASVAIVGLGLLVYFKKRKH